MYKEDLAFTSAVDEVVISFVEKLIEGSMTQSQYHSKKKYHKSKKDLRMVIKLSTAWEIYKLGGFHE